MRWFLTVATLACVGSTFAQPFTSTDRFGKSNEDVLRMGNKEWQKWFSEPSRGGDDKMRGEKIYAYAVNVRNSDLYKTKSKEDHDAIKFSNMYLSNLGKSALVISSDLYGDWKGRGLASAECNTITGLAVYELLEPIRNLTSPSEEDVWKLYEERKAVVKSNTRRSEFAVEEYNRLGLLMKVLLKHQESRPVHEKATVLRYLKYAVLYATDTRESA